MLNDAQLIMMLQRQGREKALNDAHDATATLLIEPTRNAGDERHNAAVYLAMAATMRQRNV